MIQVGVDLGGTKTEVICLEEGNEVFRKRALTPSQDYQKILETISLLCGEAEAEVGKFSQVGMGIPGAIDNGLVKNANTQSLIGKPLQKDLEGLLQLPVKIMNDANCFALSEAVDGAGKNHSLVFGIILGTGVGGGIVHNKSVLTGANLIAGEWGHNSLPLSAGKVRPDISRHCYCGRKDCVETYLSGAGLRQTMQEHGGLFETTEALNEALVSKDTVALGTLDLYASQLAEALSQVINVLDPGCIVLGGGLSNLVGLEEAVEKQIPSRIFSNSCKTVVVKNIHGDSSGVRGAAWL